MIEHPPKNECPEKEQLSAYFDKECEFPDKIEKHLKTCSACRAYLESLSEIDKSLKQKFRNNAGSDEYIVDRIVDGVRKSIEKNELCKKEKKLLFPVVWRTAVLLVIGGAIGYQLWKEMQADKQDKLNVNKVIQGSATVSASLSPATEKNGASQIRFYSNTSGIKTAVIKPEVKHVWSASALTEKQISAISSKCGIQTKTLTKNKKGWHLQFQATKIQLVRFVKNCSDNGFLLQSSEPPQPAQTSFDGNENDIVLYKADFVVENTR